MELIWNWSKSHIPNIINSDPLVDVFHINSIYNPIQTTKANSTKHAEKKSFKYYFIHYGNG